MTKDEIIQTLESFSELEENWDSYGGARITNEAIEQTKFLLESFKHDTISRINHIGPRSCGGIQIEIRNDGNADCEIYINSDGTIDIHAFSLV